MSIFEVDQLIDFPRAETLAEILSNERLDIISPFYSKWALDRLDAQKNSQVRFITRLPTQFQAALPSLDNDPRPLAKAMERLGSALSVFALPTVHAKLYISPERSWLGSANLSRNGFSGKGELLIRISPTARELNMTFSVFLKESKKIDIKQISFLVNGVNAGVTKVNTSHGSGKASSEAPEILKVQYDDFCSWISTQSSSYIKDRIFKNKNRMSGHVYSGFYGICSFYSQNNVLAANFLKGKTDEKAIIEKLAPFIKKYGGYFGGPRGGSWNSKLSTKLGGVQDGGGAGDVVVKHLLPIVANYMREKKLI